MLNVIFFTERSYFYKTCKLTLLKWLPVFFSRNVWYDMLNVPQETLAWSVVVLLVGQYSTWDIKTPPILAQLNVLWSYSWLTLLKARWRRIHLSLVDFRVST